jgi:hypothetical protein
LLLLFLFVIPEGNLLFVLGANMNLRLITATALLAVSTSAFALDNHFERTLNVSAQPDVYVATGSGNITIHTGAGNQVQVVGHLRTGWHIGWYSDGWSDGSPSSGTKSRIDRIISNPPIEQIGNTIKIGFETDHDLYNNIAIDYDISVPDATALNLHSGSGDLTVDTDVRYLSASTGSGNIHAQKVKGASDLSTGSGNIELDTESSAEVKLRSGSGNIKLRGLASSLAARTGSGDITADLHLAGAANLATGSGNVHLHLGSDAHFDLESSTGSGSIHIDYPNAPHQDDHTRHHLTASINGGGQPLEVRTGSGDITIDSH